MKRRVEQEILDFLDAKAKNSRVTELKTVKAYASIKEISQKLDAPTTLITKIVEEFLTQNKIKLLQNTKQIRKYYGSLILPTISEESVSPSSGKTARRRYRIYAPEIVLTHIGTTPAL
ncbi:MAG: hypothetical protein ACREBQ_05240 [Nitrososphaerales archaeon]